MDFKIEDPVECKTPGVYEFWATSEDFRSSEMLVYDINTEIIGKASFSNSVIMFEYKLKVLYIYKDAEGKNCSALDIATYVNEIKGDDNRLSFLYLIDPIKVKKMLVDMML